MVAIEICQREIGWVAAEIDVLTLREGAVAVSQKDDDCACAVNQSVASDGQVEFAVAVEIRGVGLSESGSDWLIHPSREPAPA